MQRQFALAVLFAGLSPIAWAQPDGYPDPQCTRPRTAAVKPGMQTESHVGGGSSFTSGAVGSYNSRVKAFNRDAAAYNTCMHAYIDTANRDVKTVQDKTNAELKLVAERGNASLKAIQDKISQAVADANSLGAELEQENARLRK